MRGYAIVMAAALAPLAGCGGPYVPSHWLDHVPPAARAARDPLPAVEANLDTGGALYRQYCESCHGEQGTGRRGRPALDSVRIHTESDGDLYWILDNGSRNHGMPGWRSLGSTALWQLVEYIRSLPPAHK